MTAMEVSDDVSTQSRHFGDDKRQARTFVKSRYTVAPCALTRRKCSSSRGMISTKLHGRYR